MKPFDQAVSLPQYGELKADYELEAELGRGATMAVFRARERELGRDVVLKATLPGAGPEAAERLREEARLLGSLSHSHIAVLYGVRRIGRSGFCLVLQRPAGGTLRDARQQQGALPLDTVHRVLAEIGGALAHAHAHGIVHGALVPDAIHIEDGTGAARLWGLGDAHAADEPPTLPAAAGEGAAAYRAPEQAAGREADPRSDVYALGLVGYELLAGRLPDGEPWEAAIPLGGVAAVQPVLADRVRLALEGALRADPAERWADAEAFVGALLGRGPAPAHLVEGRRTILVPGGEPTPPPWGRRPPAPHARRPHRRPKLVLAAAGILAAVLLTLAALLDWKPRYVEPVTAAEARSAVAVSPALEVVGGPAFVAAVDGDFQNGMVGDTLAKPLVVRVEDDAGRPVPGVPVRFAVKAGTAAVTPEQVATDAAGRAAARWVPLSPGLHEVEATAGPLSGGVSFRALARTTGGGEEAMPGDTILATAEPEPAAVAVRSGLALGGTHTCRLDAEGAALCWGSNTDGQLGDGTGRRSAPARVAASEPFTLMAAGVTHTCGVGVSGTLYCWGAATAATGRGSTGRPAPLARDLRVTSLAAGLGHTCALGEGGRLHCWGQNADGQLGDGSRATRAAPVPAGGSRTYRAVAAGWSHTCALDAEGSAWCWGANDSGQLGDGGTESRAAAAKVSGGHRFTAIAAGSQHTCALRADGAVLCWGRNANGQLGTGSRDAASTPQPVTGDARYSALALGGVHSCALTRSGAAHCWGRNTYGQLGDGSVTDRDSPGAVAGGFRFATLQANGAQTCGTTTSGRAYCWGYNADGQLGTGTRANHSRPTAVADRD